VHPGFFRAHLLLARAYAAQGRHRECIEISLKARELSHDTSFLPYLLGTLGFAYASCGDSAAAREVLEELLRLEQHGAVTAHERAIVDTALGDWMARSGNSRRHMSSAPAGLCGSRRASVRRSARSGLAGPRFAHVSAHVSLTPEHFLHTAGSVTLFSEEILYETRNVRTAGNPGPGVIRLHAGRRPNGSSQIVLAFSGGSAYTSDTTVSACGIPCSSGITTWSSCSSSWTAPRPSTRNMLTSSGCRTSKSYLQTHVFLAGRRPPKGCSRSSLIPTGSATIYFTDVPRLRNWKDLTNRSSWGTPVASFIRKAAIFQSTDGGMSGTLPISAQLVSSKPFTLAGKTFDFKNLIPNGMTCFATGYSGTTRGKDKK